YQLSYGTFFLLHCKDRASFSFVQYLSEIKCVFIGVGKAFLCARRGVMGWLLIKKGPAFFSRKK
ncbi:MAG: hypothetical protein RSF78_11745, partial [Bacteroidales bacterium]